MDDREALVCLTAAVLAGNEDITPDGAVRIAREALNIIDDSLGKPVG